MTGINKEIILRELKRKKRSNPFEIEHYPYTHKGHEYAWDIVEDKIPSSIYLKASCIRYLNDIEDNIFYSDTEEKKEGYYFNPDKSERYLRLVQKFEHVIGNWETKNIIYEPWQCWVWMNIMGFINADTGFRRFRLAHVEVARGSGKALCLETDVPTPDRGLVKFGELKIGDKLYGSDGSICTITNKNKTHYPDAYRIHFSDKTTVDCSANHLWVTQSKVERTREKRHKKNPPGYSSAKKVYESVKSTKEIYTTLTVSGKNESNHSVKVCKPVVGDRNFAFLPYVLGYWLGDGHSGGGTFSGHQDQYEEIRKRFKSRKVFTELRKEKGKGVKFVVPHLTFWLKELGVLRNKHIPEKYFMADEFTRRELLRGLLDSDGTCTKVAGNFEFANSNEKLAHQVRRLIASLGYKATIRSKIPKYQGGEGKRSYTVTFSSPVTRPAIFGIKAKEDRRSTGPSNYCDKRYITKVEKIEKKPMFCIEVDSSDHTFLITDQYIPTHNSLMASQNALFMLALDNPNGNMISTVATKKEQARIVLDAARSMAKKNQGFLKAKGVKVLAHTITQERTDSIMRALSSDQSGLDGLNDVLAVCDELHAMKREVFEVIYSGMSKRKDSLTLCITTAGFNLNNVGYSQTSYARQVSLGKLEDDQFFSALYCIDEDDDIFDESCWIKANPNWGVSVDPVTFKAKAEKAKVTPADIPGFTVKHLNRWLSEAHAFFDVNRWDKCHDPNLKYQDFRGELARVGLDLASHIDIASISALVRKNGKYFLFEKSFIPEAALKDLGNSLYDGFVHKGELIVTPGEVINYDVIKEHLIEYSKHFKVIECMFDPWNATEMAQSMADHMEMIKFPMNTSNISEPMKKLDSIIREKEISHNGSSLYKWCLGNVVAKEDHNGNVFPRKTNVKFKIDPVVATILALAGWVKEDQETPAYEDHGVRVIKF